MENPITENEAMDNFRQIAMGHDEEIATRMIEALGGICPAITQTEPDSAGQRMVMGMVYFGGEALSF